MSARRHTLDDLFEAMRDLATANRDLKRAADGELVQTGVFVEASAVRRRAMTALSSIAEEAFPAESESHVDEQGRGFDRAVH